MKLLFKIDKFLESSTKILLLVSLLTMLILSLLNIGLRWFGNTILWIDPLVRHLVFISAFLGGVLATGNGKHIRIDILSRALEARSMLHAQKIVESIVYLFCFAILTWLAIAGIEFAQSEFQYGKANFLHIHSGFLVSIIPAGVGIIAIRFLISFCKHISESKN